MKIRGTQVCAVADGGRAYDQVVRFLSEGYSRDRIYVLARNKNRLDRLGEIAADLFLPGDDQLRARMRRMGIAENEAERLEAAMDQDKIVVIAWGGKRYDYRDYDASIVYDPPCLL